MTTISTLRDLMGKATQGELADVPHPVYHGAKHAVVVGNRVWFRFDYVAMMGANDAALFVAMHRHLPALLAVVEAAKACVATQNTHEYIASLERLENALAPLTNPEHAS